MAMQSPPTRKRQSTSVKRDTVESLSDIKGFADSTFDEIVGYPSYEGRRQPEGFDFEQREQFTPPKRKKEANLFNYQAYYEREIVKREIKQLTEQVKSEIARLKKTGENLLNEVKDVQKVTINSLPEKPGIYHIRFLEIVLNLLKTLQLKVNESRTWLQALITKKKKRGSLFAALSRKKGTQYSLSQELSSARSVQ